MEVLTDWPEIRLNDLTTIQRSGDIIRFNTVFKSGDTQDILMMSDIHFDSKHCDRKLLKRHLEEARERNAIVMMFGDIFDCMGGKYDKRTNKEDLRPEYQRANYFDVITDDAANFFWPYKDNIALITQGNHEQSILLRHEINLLKNFMEKLDATAIIGDYDGFIKFVFYEGVEKRFGIGGRVLYYNHGNGGASPVTRGVINTSRRQVSIHADYYVSGHLHAEWEVPLTRVRVTPKDTLIIEKVKHWQLGTYASTFGGRWEATKGFAAPTLGGRWVRFRYYANEVLTESTLAE